MLTRVRPFTMVAEEALIDLAEQVRAVLGYGIPGNFVECGVWRGGASFLMALWIGSLAAASRRCQGQG